ncbi:hypothetical protein ACRALDRAFT_212485 [Sodiomyces alcalophilus JCM 7366]|uniref:uncharacterized protein n=1 Tax=Sodiomyces alcalophilus JCM 7366 TaxID=591952 RepID=UPI0039B44580
MRTADTMDISYDVGKAYFIWQRGLPPFRGAALYAYNVPKYLFRRHPLCCPYAAPNSRFLVKLMEDNGLDLYDYLLKHENCLYERQFLGRVRAQPILRLFSGVALVVPAYYFISIRSHGLQLWSPEQATRTSSPARVVQYRQTGTGVGFWKLLGTQNENAAQKPNWTMLILVDTETYMYKLLCAMFFYLEWYVQCTSYYKWGCVAPSLVVYGTYPSTPLIPSLTRAGEDGIHSVLPGLEDSIRYNNRQLAKLTIFKAGLSPLQETGLSNYKTCLLCRGTDYDLSTRLLGKQAMAAGVSRGAPSPQGPGSRLPVARFPSSTRYPTHTVGTNKAFVSTDLLFPHASGLLGK